MSSPVGRTHRAAMRDSAASDPAYRAALGRLKRMTTYPLALRDGVFAELRLPDGLTQTEADRVAAYVQTLVVEPVSNVRP